MTTSAEQERVFDLSVLRCAAGTDVGMRRDENQDSFGIIKGDSFYGYFVADGMGGVHGGAVASRMAISILEEVLPTSTAPLSCDQLSLAVKTINSRIFEKGSSDTNLAGMGTTIVGLVFTPHATYTVNVGDSRAYRVRGTAVVQLSEDHTLVRELVKSGAISPDQIENHPVSHMLTRSLGPLADVSVDCRTLNEWPEVGDVYLLCSDGLYNFVSEDEILEVVRQNPLDDANQILINLANQRGGADNITVVVISVGDLAGKGRTAAYRKARDASVRGAIDSSQSSDTDPASLAAARSVEGSVDDVTLPDGNPAGDAEVAEGDVAAQEAGQGNGVLNPPPISEPPPHRDGKAYRNVKASSSVQAKEASPSRSPSVLALVGVALVFGLVAGNFARRYFDRENRAASPVIALDTDTVSHASERVATPAVRRPEESPPSVAVSDASAGIEVRAEATPVAESPSEMESLGADSGKENAADRVEAPQGARTDSARILKTKEMFESAIKRIDTQLLAFDNPDSAEVNRALLDARRQTDDLQGKLGEVEQQIDAASRKLSQWYQRQKRLESQDALKLAAEVGASSPAVQEKKAALERITYEYISVRDQFDLYPSNERLREQLSSVTEKRSGLLRELRDEVRRAVEGVLAETDGQLEELKFQRDMINIQLATVKQDLEVAKSLAEPDVQQRRDMRSKLEQKRQGLKSSLVELDSLLESDPPRREMPESIAPRTSQSGGD